MRRRSPFLAAALLPLAWAALAYDLIEPLAPIPLSAGVPSAVAAAGDRVFVLDGKRDMLLIFDASGRPIKSIGGRGPERGRFSSPQGLAVGPDGEVAVADTGNNRVQVFDAEGKFLSSFGGKGSEPGKMRAPRSVAFGAYGQVLVADTDNARVQAFTREGVFLFALGSKGKEEGRFKRPTRVAVDPSDRLYVLDEGNRRMQTFDPGARFIKAWPLSAEDFDVDEFGYLYALEGGKVREYGPDGRLLGSFGTEGSAPTQFRAPAGVAAGPDGVVLVADAGNARVQRARLSSKRKLERLRPDLATRLTVSPAKAWNFQASAVAAGAGAIYAYLPKPRRFVALGEDGKELFRFGAKPGKEDSETRGTRGMAVSPAHGVFVADTDGGRVQVFDLKGGFKFAFGQARGAFESASKEGRVKTPVAVTINEAGTVYVVDEGNRRVGAFSPDGSYLFGIGPRVGGLELQRPVGAAFDPAGSLFVLDAKLKKVLKLEPSGGFAASWGEEGSGPGQFLDPVAIAYDGLSYLYVLDQGNTRVSVFTREGKWVTDMFSRGDDDRSLADPSSLAVMGDDLLVSDPTRARLLAIRLGPRLAPPAAVSVKSVEGQAQLSWEPSADPWLARYRVFRATQPFGPYVDVGESVTLAFKDAGVEADRRYFYRVGAQSRPGEVGPLSRRVEVAVEGASNRAPVEISTVSIGNIFPSRYKWYLKNPLGSVTVKNNLGVPFQNVSVSFRLKDFMDFPTEKLIATLEAGRSVEVPVLATLNNRILEVTEDTPIQAEVSATFFEKGEKRTASRAFPLRVYARNAITWEDPRRIASFITPKDPPVFRLGSDILHGAAAPGAGAFLNPALVKAIELWSGLGALGYKFAPSPNNPFEKMVEDPAFPVDYTQFPRDTVLRRSGECDDLTTLFASLLEGQGVRAAVLDYPGHVAVMFDTGEDDPVEVGLPKEQLIEHGGTLWIPVETTMVGAPFDEAVRKALFAYREMSKAGKARVIDPREVVDIYEPATLPPVEDKADPIDAKELERRAALAREFFARQRLEFLRLHWGGLAGSRPGDPEIANKLGIILGQHALPAEAEKEFARGLAADPANPAILNNLGNLAFLRGAFEDAAQRYQKAAQADPHDAGIWMNLARAAMKLGRRAQAVEAGEKAVALDRNLKPDLDTVLK